MRVGIDWDGTFSSDVELWSLVARVFILRGYEVCVVTARPKGSSDDILDSLCFWGLDAHVEVYEVGVKTKRAYMESIGKSVDVWIDDYPEDIVV